MHVKPNAYLILKKLRKDRGLTGAELARRMDLGTPQHYWNIENNKNRLTLEYAYAAAKALNVSVKKFCN